MRSIAKKNQHHRTTERAEFNVSFETSISRQSIACLESSDRVNQTDCSAHRRRSDWNSVERMAGLTIKVLL